MEIQIISVEQRGASATVCFKTVAGMTKQFLTYGTVSAVGLNNEEIAQKAYEQVRGSILYEANSPEPASLDGSRYFGTPFTPQEPHVALIEIVDFPIVVEFADEVEIKQIFCRAIVKDQYGDIIDKKVNFSLDAIYPNIQLIDDVVAIGYTEDYITFSITAECEGVSVTKQTVVRNTNVNKAQIISDASTNPDLADMYKALLQMDKRLLQLEQGGA